MKLYLFGGAELDIPKVSPIVLKHQIKKILLEINPKSILHIPFARLHPTEEEWKEGWFKDIMNDTGVEIFDARNESDLDKAKNAVIFINGGMGRRDLILALETNQKLLNLVLNAQFIIAESAGSMAMGEYLRADRDGKEVIRGVGILKNTIIEPHYSEKIREALLIDDMNKSGMKYGIGIDCATALVVDPTEFPDKWKKIGVGDVYIKTK